MDNTFIIESSNGQLEAEVDTGKVVKVVIDEGGDKHIGRITRFDVEEFNNYYKGQEYGKIEAHCHVDILDMGYWYKEYYDEIGEWEENLYEPPCMDWRTDGDINEAKSWTKLM